MAESQTNMLNQFDINNLNSKFQNRNDLHNYMKDRRKQSFSSSQDQLSVNMWLPEKKKCSKGFLAKVLGGQKELFETSEIVQYNFKESWPEFAIKNVWHLVNDEPEVLKYLPDDDINNKQYPDRKFFWGVLSTVREQWTKEFIDEVVANRNRQVPDPLCKKIIAITGKWKEKLSKFDFKSTHKRGKQSVFIQHEVKLKQKRNKKSLFQVPEMPMNKFKVIQLVNEEDGSVTDKTDQGNLSQVLEANDKKIKVNIEDDIESKISKCTVMRKLDQTRARNEPFKFREHQTFEEFKQGLKVRQDSKQGSFFNDKKSLQAGSPDKVSQKSKKRTRDEFENDKDQDQVSTKPIQYNPFANKSNLALSQYQPQNPESKKQIPQALVDLKNIIKKE